MEEKKREELSFASCFDLAALLEVALSTKWRISPAAETLRPYLRRVLLAVT